MISHRSDHLSEPEIDTFFHLLLLEVESDYGHPIHKDEVSYGLMQNHHYSDEKYKEGVIKLILD